MTEAGARGQVAPRYGALPLRDLSTWTNAGVRFHAVRPDGYAGCSRTLALDLGRTAEASAVPDWRLCRLAGCVNRWHPEQDQ